MWPPDTEGVVDYLREELTDDPPVLLEERRDDRWEAGSLPELFSLGD